MKVTLNDISIAIQTGSKVVKATGSLSPYGLGISFSPVK